MISGFMHVLGNERGQQIVLEQIARLKRSGLWDRSDRVYIGSVGAEVWLPSDPKIEHFHDHNPSLFETFTLSRLFDVCQAGDCACWYIHTKGASWTAVDPRWRHHMEASVIDGHQECVAALAAANTCGPVGINNPEPLYAGNFWWARADYVRSLIPPKEWSDQTVARGGDARMSAETWIIQANYHRHLFLTYGPPLLELWRTTGV